MNSLWWAPSWTTTISTAHTQDEQQFEVNSRDGEAGDELTQFPVYGTCVNSTKFPENRVPTAHEWLQLGVGLGEEEEDDDDEKEVEDDEDESNNENVSSTQPRKQQPEKKKTEEWEETLWHTETALQSSEAPEKPQQLTTSENHDKSIVDRQHWMPDQLCKQCNSCEAPFTVFRRRHHCRRCGQVFCSSCSAYFVPYNNTTQRVCQLCRDQLVKDGENDGTKHKGDGDAVHTVAITEQAPPQAQPANGLVGQVAAQHLESMATELIRVHAASIWNSSAANREKWIHQLLTLATRCCATVEPNVRKGDLLDVRPYVKIKRIAGGCYSDCAYLSGVVFRKTVTHKRMAKCLQKPIVLLLAGSLDFYGRTENHFASLDTLFEQETKYLEILINKITKLKPDIVIIGRSASRKAQEMLLRADIVLIQRVKASLLDRIARQTGATVISSTDQLMNQFGTSVLGHCERFRLVTFRNNEAYDPNAEPRNSVEREAALCAQQLGDKVWDGATAVKSGLAKRGVANTFVMLEGCPKNLGCTIVLRGGTRDFLAQVKNVLRFLVHVAYNIRLETTFLRERGAVLRSTFSVSTAHTQSSSLAVDFGPPPVGRKVRPWNGDNVNQNEQGEITAMDHQSILITSVWMADKSQCCPAEVKGICYYSLQDVALGQFLRDSCFNLSLKCQNPSCKKTVLDHSLAFVHNDGLINITVEELDTPFPGEADRDEREDLTFDEDGDESDKPIVTWTYCKNCKKNVTIPVFISENTWKWSFGKFLEVFFYNRDGILQECGCLLQSSVLYYGCDSLAARFTYEPVKPYGVFVRKTLPIVLQWHRQEAMRRLDVISIASSELFVKFDKHIEKVSREARSLFNSANNRPEHLQTVLSELNRIGSEVDLAAKTLQEKIASVSDSCRQSDEVETVLRFPGLAKRYLFMLMSAWNEKLTATGQAMSAMKKLAGVVGTNPGDPLQDELLEGMRRLKELNEQYARYDVVDINQILPSVPNPNVFDDDDEFDDQPDTTIDFTVGVDADVLASRRRLQKTSKGPVLSTNECGRSNNRPTAKKTLGTRRQIDDSSSSMESNIPQKSTPGGAVKSAITRFFNRGGREYESYRVDLGIFSEGRPRLAPGANGIIVPVLDEQLSTIIAYSLVSSEYAKQFKHYSKFEGDTDDVQAAQSHRQQQQGKPSDQSGAPSLEGTLPCTNRSSTLNESTRAIERKMLNRKKSHIKITFRDYDEKGRVTCKFVCTAYWATQFHAVREVFLSKNGDDGEKEDIERSYTESLSSAYSWAASGGKSGASFARTNDDRFVMKNISRTELQMFLECSSAYFEYLSKAFFHGLPTVLCKIVGVYQIGVHNRITGKRTMEQVAVMQNIFYNKKISKIFDLKGSLRGRFAAQRKDESQEDSNAKTRNASVVDSDNNSILDGNEQANASTVKRDGPATLLDGDFLDFTRGRPLPLTDRAKALFQMSILNDTLFLSIINVLDYSILVGVDEESNELVVGIIDFMRQYDILKQMERVGKSLPMVVGSEAPTIIQPPLYKARFTNAMERYFMTVPNTWTSI